MINTASSLSKKIFQKMIAGGKGYVPKKIDRELRSAGLTFSTSRVSRQKAMRALNHLRGKKLLPKTKNPSQLYQNAAVEQYRQDQAAIKAEKQKHIRTNIAMDIIEEIQEEDAGQDVLKYNPHSVLGETSILSEIERERQTREKKIKNEQEKRAKLTNPKGVRPKKVDLAELPDMPIDFGD